MKTLVIVDVQKEFNKFIQHDLVDEIYKYCEKFDRVYQVWDTNKNVMSPTYKFPKEIKSVAKKFGKNHFNDKVKKYTKEIKDSTEEGTVLKLSDGTYVVRVDNNHDWFYVNDGIVQLILELKNDEVILVGGADNECLEDVYVAFKSFGVNVRINDKYVYSAKTSNNDSVHETQIRENLKNIKEIGFSVLIKNKREHDDLLLFLKNNFIIIDRYEVFELFPNIFVFFTEKISGFRNDTLYHAGYDLSFMDGFIKNYPALKGKMSPLFENIEDFKHYINKHKVIYNSINDRSQKIKNWENFNENNEWFPYRFKTENEFIEEFGHNWKRRIESGWASHGEMDYLFGQIYPHNINIDNRNYVLPSIDGWSISWDMLTPNKKIEPTLTGKLNSRENWENWDLSENIQNGEIPITILCDNRDESIQMENILHENGFMWSGGFTYMITDNTRVRETTISYINFNSKKFRGFQTINPSLGGAGYTVLSFSKDRDKIIKILKYPQNYIKFLNGEPDYNYGKKDISDTLYRRRLDTLNESFENLSEFYDYNCIVIKVSDHKDLDRVLKFIKNENILDHFTISDTLLYFLNKNIECYIRLYHDPRISKKRIIVSGNMMSRLHEFSTSANFIFEKIFDISDLNKISYFLGNGSFKKLKPDYIGTSKDEFIDKRKRSLD